MWCLIKKVWEGESVFRAEGWTVGWSHGRAIKASICMPHMHTTVYNSERGICQHVYCNALPLCDTFDVFDLLLLYLQKIVSML